MDTTKILMIGACGQIGTELLTALRKKHGVKNVIAADRRPDQTGLENYTQLDALDFEAMEQLVKTENVTQIYHLAAMLSATGEKEIHKAWELNMTGLINVLKIAESYKLDKVFWPSSIAVFGPDSPKQNCPQNTFTEPNTIYGISKRAGEFWCNYYFEKFGVDVRSIRYPGLISYTSLPGGGTTDYAVDIFHQAIEKKNYTCYSEANTTLPMMYMPDAIRATLSLMDAPKEHISIRTSYNIAALSFSPQELAAAIQKHIPDFEITYQPDSRLAIAKSWPESIDDTPAQQDWNWKPQFPLEMMVDNMLKNLNEQKINQSAALPQSY